MMRFKLQHPKLATLAAIGFLGLATYFGYEGDKALRVKQDAFNKVILLENDTSKAPVKKYLENTLHLNFNNTFVQPKNISSPIIFDDEIGLGEYNSKDDKIYVTDEFYAFSSGSSSKGDFKPLKESSLKSVLAHEYGHDYTQQIIDQLYVSGDVPFDSIPYGTLSEVVVSEGIAESFRLKFDQKKHVPIGKDSLSLLVARMNNHPENIYSVGLELMNPIIDTFGVKYAIEKTYSNMPTFYDLLEPDVYLESLKDNK